MGKMIEGVWDCKYCGAARIGGGNRVCPQCGKPRGTDAKFYRAEIQYVSTAVAANASRNPDWYCGYCDTLNSDTDAFCRSCGASKADSTMNYFALQEEKRRKAAAAAQAAGGGSQANTSQAATRTRGRGLLPLIFAALIALFVILPMIPRSGAAQVTQKYWQTVTAIEEYRTVQDSGWQAPPDAYNISERQEIQSYNSVLDHYETKTRTYYERVLDHYDEEVTYKDLGNGYFEEQVHQVPVYRNEPRTETYQDPVYIQVPIYGTKYYYTVDRWVHDHNETLSGTDDNVRYYTENLRSNTRVGNTSAEYSVTVQEKKKERTYKVSEELWNQLETGQSYKLKTRNGWIIGAEEEGFGGL